MSAAPCCVVDLDRERERVSSFRRKVEKFELRRQHPYVPCTIFRVPPRLRDVDPDAYDPEIVSLGPYHRNKPGLSYMEQFKFRHLQKILERNPNVRLDDYLEQITEGEAHARASYSEDIDMDSNGFVEMMLLDGAFLVEFFLFLMRMTDGEQEDNPLLTNPENVAMIQYDMIKLENQIPFFILERIFKLATNTTTTTTIPKLATNENANGLNTLLLSSFKYLVPSCKKMTVPTESDFYHLLHLFRFCLMPENYPQSSQPQIRTRFYKPLSVFSYLRRNRHAEDSNTDLLPHSSQPQIETSFYKPFTLWMSSVFSYFRGNWQAQDSNTDSTPPLQSVPCATKLQLASVKFQKSQDKSFLDVTFHDGTLEIPALELYDETNSLLRNLIAFEQRFPKVGLHVSTYAAFMDQLIDTGNDVALLHHYSCIVNSLGNHDEAAQLFNSICKNVYINHESNYLSSLVKDVKKHYDSRWNNWRAELMSDYFGNPWLAISLGAAIFLILLTVIQSVFAVLAYFRPPH